METVNAERYRVSVFKIISLHLPAILLRKIITEKATKASSPHAKKKKKSNPFLKSWVVADWQFQHSQATETHSQG